MEKIKFGTEVFDLVPVGATFGEDKARITIVLPDGTNYETVEIAVSGKERIEILDEDGEVLAAHKGYIYLDSLTKQKNRVIGTTQVVTGTDKETQEPIYTNQEVTATVMIVTLKRADVRQEVEEMKANLDYVAMMAGIEMEV